MTRPVGSLPHEAGDSWWSCESNTHRVKKEPVMLNKIMALTIMAALAVLLMPSRVDAWGAARVSGVRVGPGGGVYGGSRTVVAGPGGVYAGGRAYGVGGYGGVYRGGYGGAVRYGGYYGGYGGYGYGGYGYGPYGYSYGYIR
jgi:hypothetical protein